MKFLGLAVSAAAIFVSTATLSLAEDTGASCALNYEVFEASVPHTDLETCPGSTKIDGGYCRLSLVAEVATIFAFSENTDCLIASQSYDEEKFTFLLN